MTVTGWKMFAPHCDLLNGVCKRSQNVEAKVTYVFPRWISSTAINYYTQTGPLGNPNMQLKQRNVMMTDAYRLAQTGNVQGLEDLYVRGLASIDDVNPQEGQSALLVNIYMDLNDGLY